jgi:hypothetical protein
VGVRLRIDRHAVAALVVCALVLLAGCLAAGGPVSASAGSAAPRAEFGDVVSEPADALFPVDGPSMARARELAESHWGATPCDGAVVLAWAPLEPGTNATASWRNPTHAWDNAGENFDCRIDFNTRADFDWPKLCTVMTHEIGHLLGRQHTGDPGDVMAALYSQPLPECREAADPARPEPVVEVEPPDDEIEAVAAAPRRSSRDRTRSARAARRRAARCRAARRALGGRLSLRGAKRLGCRLPRATRRTLRAA